MIEQSLIKTDQVDRPQIIKKPEDLNNIINKIDVIIIHQIVGSDNRKDTYFLLRCLWNIYKKNFIH